MVTAAGGVRNKSRLRVHRFLPDSLANGPGRRAVLWLQGCTLGCPGCFNPETHSSSAGKLISVDEVFDLITARTDTVEGVTFSGGEPLQQSWPLLSLVDRLRRETSLSLLLFTGYTWQEVLALPVSASLLDHLDVVIAGRYDARQRLAHGLRGSANQSVHLLTTRYSPADLDSVPPAEMIITADGRVELSGIDPVLWSPAV